MPAFGRSAVLPAMLVASMATLAGAQKACEPDENTPNQVARATLSLQLASSAAKPEDAAPKLREAFKYLGEADKARNPVGRNYVLGKALVLSMMQPSIGLSAKRSTLGYTTDPETVVDLVAAVDEAFTAVETAMPECAAQLSGWRQQKPWVDMVNSANEQASADKSDSAEVLAKRSLQLYRGAPYAYFILAQIATKKEQIKPALAFYKQAIAVATDTSMADNRRQAWYLMGTLAAEAAEILPDTAKAEKASYLAESKAAFEALSKDPGSKYAEFARSGLARVASAAGDTASLRASYQDKLANPSAFSYNSLMMAAVTAAKADQNGDAIKLFEAAYKVNPYHRDVMYNLARLYMLNNDYQKGMPVVKSLVAADPANPDNYQLYALAWLASQKTYVARQKALDSTSAAYGKKANASKVAAAQKAFIDSAARITPLLKAYSDSSAKAVDSALKYNDMNKSLPARITFNEFTNGETKTTLGGTLVNNTDAEKTFAFKIDFVDKGGAVVGSQDVSVGPVRAHGSKSFTVTVNAPGVVAFKYSMPN